MLPLVVILLAQVLNGNGALRPGGSGISGPFQQVAKCNGALATNPSTTCVFAVNVDQNSLGATLVVYAAAGGLQTTWNIPTKSAGTATVGTFTTQGTCLAGNGGGNLCLWTAPITGTGSLTITISASSSGSTALAGIVFELNNQVVGTTNVLSTYEAHTNCTSCILAGLTTTGPNRAVLTFISKLGGAATLTSPSPFTFALNAKDSQNSQLAAGFFVQASAGAYSPTVTNNNTTLLDVSIAIF